MSTNLFNRSVWLKIQENEIEILDGYNMADIVTDNGLFFGIRNEDIYIHHALCKKMSNTGVGISQ